MAQSRVDISGLATFMRGINELWAMLADYTTILTK